MREAAEERPAARAVVLDPARVTPPASMRRRRRILASSTVRDGCLVALVSAVGFALFQPDWYHNQNGLDPYFYTGLAVNLSDSLDYGAAAHYFVSRWSLYVPELLAQRLLGPSVGFVAVRLLLLTLGGIGLALLRPAASRRLDLVPVAVVGLFSPLLARSVFVDYSDAIVVPCGLVMAALAARGRVGIPASAAIGALAACAVVANAFAMFMVAITAGAYLLRSLRRPGLLLVQLGTVAAAAAVVVAAGLLFFRWRYGIANVYEPTVDFVLDNAGYQDPLKSPRLLWLQYRVWIYLPPLVLLTAAVLRAARVIRLGTGDLVVLGICAAQYAFQVLYQAAAGGSTLEIIYYFSYMVPAYTAALAVVLYALLQRCPPWATAALTVALVVVLGAWRFLPEVRLGSWVVFAVAAAVLAVVGLGLGRRMPVAPAVGIVSLVLAAQLAPPAPEPALPGELRVQPGYDSLYRGTSLGVARFRAVTSFVRRMHGLDLEVRKRAGWVVVGGLAPQMAATYSVQVGVPTRWLNPPLVPVQEYRPDDITRFAVDRFAEQGLDHVVVVCSPEALPGILDRLRALGLVLDAPLLSYSDREAEPETSVHVAPARVAAFPAT